MSKKLKRLFFLFSVLSLSLSFPLSAESTYIITESEKIELEKILETYRTIQNDLEQQKKNYEEITKSLQNGLTDLQKENQKKLIKDCIIVGSVTFTVGAGIGVVATSIIMSNMRN